MAPDDQCRVHPRSLHAAAELATLASNGLETGGIVLGHDACLAGPIIVTACGAPVPQAIRRRSYFQRDMAYTSALAEQAAAVDGSVWVGKWHTHNTAMPQPSDRDLRAYQWLLDHPELAFLRILAVIVLPGAAANWDAPVVHSWSFMGTALRQMGTGGLPGGVLTTPQPGDWS